MNLRHQLLKTHSKENADLIKQHILNNPDSFSDLMDIFINEDYRLIQRSAWVVGLIGNHKPEWIIPYLPQLIKCLETPKHDAVSRNIYRVLQNISIPDEYDGALYSLCLRDLSNPKSAVAIKVFGMTVAFNIAQKYPELKEELALVIEEQMPYGSKGYLSRAKKLLLKLRR